MWDVKLVSMYNSYISWSRQALTMGDVKGAGKSTMGAYLARQALTMWDVKSISKYSFIGIKAFTMADFNNLRCNKIKVLEKRQKEIGFNNVGYK